MKQKREKYLVHSIYDTETSNLEYIRDNKKEHSAICILYIFNNISGIDLPCYIPDHENEDIYYLRTQTDALLYVESVIVAGKIGGYIPIIAAYNLMFDLQTIIYELNNRYKMQALAQSSTHVYTLDLFDNQGNKVLRFWDTYYLEMGGLAAMGKTCGFQKASGDWVYSLIRSPETELSEKELYYAKCDVQVIPAYLRYILESNTNLKSDMLGAQVLTKTGLVRQMAKDEIGKLKYINARGRSVKLRYAYEQTCKQEAAKTYESYAIRKASFRGGWTFTAAATASVVVENVASLDVTSMHHTFINGRFIPVHFTEKHPVILQKYMDVISKTTLEDVLKNYSKPFFHSFHACISFTNLRLKKNSVFAHSHIALCPESKFKIKSAKERDIVQSEHGAHAEEAIKAAGYNDKAYGATFAFGKLYSASYAEIFLNEIEFWCICQVYDFDAATPLYGEGTIKFARPPDYVIAQSHTLYKRKNAMKELLKRYSEGEPLKDMPEGIPEGIADACVNGTADRSFLEAYYNSTVKGMFNGVYGTQAQDVFKPDYDVSEGLIALDLDTTLTPENWDSRQPKKHTVLYNYGMRIVAGSRMHLVIACMLIYEALGTKVDILGGDTDSLKIACSPAVSDDDLIAALQPLAIASKSAIDRVSNRLRETLPKYSSDLAGVGAFEIEKCGGTTRYKKHMELWNKARVSLDSDNRVHVTCAGLSRPPKTYTIEKWIEDTATNIGFDRAVNLALGYNVEVKNEVSHMLQRTHPASWDIVDGYIVDYQGVCTHIHQPAAICLYPESRIIGETDKISNMENVAYLRREFKRDINTADRSIGLDDGKPYVDIVGEWGIEREQF